MIYEIIHAGADQRRRADVHSVWTGSGLAIATEPTEQVTMGQDSPFDWAHDRDGLRTRIGWIDQNLAMPAARYMLDYEPKGIDWSGREGKFDPRVLNILHSIAVHTRAVNPGALIGVYGYPANQWWAEYVTPDAYDAAQRMLMRIKPDVFYVPVYLTHNAGEHDPDAGTISPKLIERRVRAVVGACLMLAANLDRDIEIVPMLQTRLRHPDKAHNLAPVTAATAEVWARAVMGCGIERACIWTEYPLNHHPDPDREIDNRIDEHQTAIRGLLAALGEG